MHLTLSNGEGFEFTPKSLVIAGFTGKNRLAARTHIEELSREGIAVPSKIPSFYLVDPSMITLNDIIEVGTRESSGEVEPVLITTRGKRYIAVGSDHTPRDLEKKSIADSKRACQKPVSGHVFDLEYVLQEWKNLELSSRVTKNGNTSEYQHGPISTLMDIDSIVSDLLDSQKINLDNSVIFLGTIPLLGGQFIFGEHYYMELSHPLTGEKLSLSYVVKIREREM
jgi:hypothetical protein